MNFNLGFIKGETIGNRKLIMAVGALVYAAFCVGMSVVMVHKIGPGVDLTALGIFVTGAIGAGVAGLIAPVWGNVKKP